jgi:F-type H+-transporting ATPase subunit alpha
VPVVDVRRFEAELHEFLRARHADLLATLATQKLNDEVKGQLEAAVDAFRAGFVSSEQPEVEDENVGWDAMAASSETVG